MAACRNATVGGTMLRHPAAGSKIASATYRLGRAGEAELVAEPALCLVGVALHQVGHRVTGAAAVHHLGRAVVRVHDVGPRDVAEIFASLQLLDGLAYLR